MQAKAITTETPMCHALIDLASLQGKESGDAGGVGISCARASQLKTHMKAIP